MTTAHDQLIRRKALAEELDQSPTTIWRWTKSGLLPKPVRIGQTVGWPRSVIDAWKIEQGWPAPAEEPVAASQATA